MNAQQQSQLMESISKAREILDGSNVPSEALEKAGITTDFIQKVRGYLNNPLSSFILPVLGVDKKTAMTKLNEIESIIGKNNSSMNESMQMTPKPSATLNQAGGLEKFKRGIRFLK